MNEYQRAYYKRSGKQRRSIEVWKAKNHAKVLAHRAVWRATRDGRLRRPKTCPRCLKRVKIQAHHKDYTQQLKVTWLCSRCHGREHRDHA